MSKADKTLKKVMSGEADANISFDDVVHLLLKLGFLQRRSGGSHIVFQSGADLINLQNFHGKVKKCQVRQVREILKNR